jgi:hypothetical protein
MSDADVLLVVLAGIYLIDCASWQRYDVVAFAQPWLGRWRIVSPGGLFGHANAGLVMGNPLPPLGGLVTTQPLPVSLGPDGVYAHVSQNLHPTGWPAYPGDHVAWEGLAKVRSDGSAVVVGQRVLARTMSAREAEWLADTIARLAACPAGERTAAIEAVIADTLSTERAAERLDAFRQEARGVLIRGNLLLVSIVGGLAAVTWWEPAQQRWPVIVLSILLLVALAVVGFAAAHRRLFPEARRRRWKQVLRLIVSPPALVRAADSLGQDVAAGLHPLAVAAVLVDRTTFESFARRVVADLAHPCSPTCPSELPAALATEAWYRERLLTAVRAMLTQAGIDIESLLAPPHPEVDSNQSYCPRCRSQYESESGQCEPCGNMTLMPLREAAG